MSSSSKAQSKSGAVAPPKARARQTRSDNGRKDQVIQIRTTAETKSLLLRAAEIEGRSLSDYVLHTARKDALDAILDRRVFSLTQERFEALLDELDNPRPLDPEVRERFNRKPLWDE